MAGPEVLFERIADVIESQRQQALTEYALTELRWHRHGVAVTDSADQANAGRIRHAA